MEKSFKFQVSSFNKDVTAFRQVKWIFFALQKLNILLLPVFRL